MFKIKNGSQGFTLIELLVVVVIIGILAAIALPQYQLAVDKAKFAEVKQLSHIIQRAYTSYMFNNGNAPSNFSDLDINLPDSFVIKKQQHGGYTFYCADNGDTFCCMGPYGAMQGFVNCGKSDGSFVYQTYITESNGNLIPPSDENKNYRQCILHPNDPPKSRYVRLCKEMGFGQKLYTGFVPLMLDTVRAYGGAYVMVRKR